MSARMTALLFCLLGLPASADEGMPQHDCRQPVKDAQPLPSKYLADAFVWNAIHYFDCIEAFKDEQRQAAALDDGDAAAQAVHLQAIRDAEREVREFRLRYWK